MDIREVIEGLNLIDNVIVDYVSGRRKGFTDDETERLVYKAVTQAIELLEKQLPKQCKKDVYKNQVCPNCESILQGRNQYCGWCGQRLDWS